MKKYLPTNCPNCGAVLKGDHCDYCGTRIKLANSIDVLDHGLCELTLNFKSGDAVFIMPLIGRVETITRTSEPITTVSCFDGSVIRHWYGPETVEFTFCGRMNDD